MFGRRMPARLSALVAVAVLATCAVAAGTARAATSTLQPTADALVTAAAPRINFGTAPLLGTALTPDTRSYLRFDVSRAPVPAQSVQLSIYALNAGDGFEVRAVAPPNAWSESRITWSNAPPPGPSTGSFTGSTNGPGWVTVDATDIVTAAAAAHQPAEFVILAGGPHPTAYVSREGPRGYAPRLVVSNDATPPEISITSPVDLASSPSAKTTITGTAGTAPGDNSTVTVQIYPGEDTEAAPLQTITTRVSRTGTFSVTTGALPAGEYIAAVSQSDADGNVSTTYTRFFVGGP